MNGKPAITHTVLWADDDLDDLMIMREILERNDISHKVVEVYNGCEVLRHLSQVKSPPDLPCLIVLDINMPVLDGRETLVRIRAEKKYDGIPVVMFTTSSSEMDRAFCRRYGAKMYTKPSSYLELVQMVQSLLMHCKEQNISMENTMA